MTNEPKIEWEAYNLDPNIPDDRIIATTLELIADYKNEIIIITSDIGLILKAKSKQIGTHKLSDSLLIKIKKTDEEKKISKLRDKLAIYENRLPRLSLCFIDENDITKLFKIKLKKVEQYSDEQQKNVITELKNNLAYKPKQIDPSNSNARIVANFSYIHQDEIKRYENDVDKHLKDFELYFKKEWKYRESISRIVEVNFILINEGTAPADDIDIFIHFPDGFEMFDSKKYPKKPTHPEEPEPPRTMSELMRRNMDFIIPPHLLAPILRSNNFIPPKTSDYSPKITKTNSYDIKYKIERLKHGLNVNLDPVFLLFDSIDSADSFSIDCKIICGNHPESFEEKLHIIITK